MSVSLSEDIITLKHRMSTSMTVANASNVLSFAVLVTAFGDMQRMVNYI
jgi:hypothetical protein